MRSDTREPAAIALLEKLEDVSYSDYILLGHQNAGHIGVSISSGDGTQSDIKNLTGRHPAVVGIDTLSFQGYEGRMDELVKAVKQLHREGCIITLSAHMPNFSLGGDAFIDYTPNIFEGDVGTRIMPGGDLNGKYCRFLDSIAEFANQCIDLSGERIPMIFRPFHECNGSWFWWGADHLSDGNYIALFRFTIDYLRREKGISSFLYSYSPNGWFESEEKFMSRYPGDDYCDIIGMDIYDDRPHIGSDFGDKLMDSLEKLQSCAEEHGKIYALTEIGLRTLDSNRSGYYEGLAPEKNAVRTWFTDLLRTVSSSEAGMRMAYMLFWANFSDTQFWIPYVKGSFRHEMCDDFLQFVNSGIIRLA